MKISSDYVNNLFAVLDLGRLGEYSIKIDKINTGFNVLVRTPFSGYEALKMKIGSDFVNNLFAALDLGRLGEYSIKIDKINTGFNVLVRTPFSGYEALNFEIKYRVSHSKD
jgi:hypothetical protein